MVVFVAGIVMLKNQVNRRTAELSKRNRELISEIADRKRAEEEKETIQAQLIQAQKLEAVGTLAGGIAHEFNISLQAISNYVELMKYERSQAGQSSIYFDHILNIIRNSSNLTRQLLTVSRKIESKLKPTNLNDQILRVQKLLERTVPKMIKIELDLEKDLKVIQADSGQIEQILLNLALNASHAMADDGQITIKTQNVILDKDSANIYGDADPGEYALLTVTDTGHGIAKEVQGRVFEPFFTTKAPGQGTGLGLSMVYGIVKNHHGHIEYESEPGEGTKFSIYFPVSNSDDVLKEDITAKKVKITTGNEIILLIEDNESILDAVERMLQHFGYTVITASYGEQAIEIYQSQKDTIDLVILTLNMPGMGGRKCLEKLIEIKPDLKTVVTSGYTSAANLNIVQNGGNTVFVEKPYQLEELLRIVRDILDRDNR